MPVIHRIEEWTPYKHIIRLRDSLLADWIDRLRRDWDGGEATEVAARWRLFADYRASLKVVADYSRAWGLDPAPCFQFAEVDRRPESPYVEPLYERLMAFLTKCVEEAEVQWRLVGGATTKGVRPESVGVKRVICPPGETLKTIPPRYWEPFFRSAHIKDLVWEWYELTKRLGHHTDEERVQYHFMWCELRDALRALSVRAQTFGLDVDPIYAFQRFEGGKPLQDIRDAMSDLMEFVHRYEDTAEAQYQLLKASSNAPDELSVSVPEPSHSSPPAAASATPTAEGPQPPNILTWKAKSVTLQPIPWKILEFLWSKRTAKESEIIDHAWGHDSDAEGSAGALKGAINKASRALAEVGCPYSVSRKSGYVTLG